MSLPDVLIKVTHQQKHQIDPDLCPNVGYLSYPRSRTLSHDQAQVMYRYWGGIHRLTSTGVWHLGLSYGPSTSYLI